MYKDYYKILGVGRTASSHDIKQAYYKLAKVFHPDMNRSPGNNHADFNEISEAYSVLGNLDKRLDYSLMIYEMEELQQEARDKYLEKKAKTKKATVKR